MHSQSIGSGRVTGGGDLTLRSNPSIEDPEKFSQEFLEQPQTPNGAGSEQHDVHDAIGVGDGDAKPQDTLQSVIGYEDPIMLTQSTHSFLFTEPTCSAPFNFGLAVMAISYICLFLALINNLYDNATPGNPFSVPVRVSLDVKIAQYLALLIGLLMEEEIPESLYLLRMITEKTLKSKEPRAKYGKFITCALLRIVCGYLFYLNMFTVVVQATEVIEIFFDVMALQFLQQIDDIAFRLAKMDVFGKKMKRASTRKCFRAEFPKLPYSRRKKMTIFVKATYLVNLFFMIFWLTMITVKQRANDYYCKSITVKFSDHIWENALVLTPDGGVRRWDLIYSYFSGVYVLNGTHDGRALYTEQNKFDDSPYQQKIGATIKYCKEENAWVFMHEHIRKDRNTKDSKCPWLLRSPDTNSFDLLEVSGDWQVWTGIISTGATFGTTCNGCHSEAGCNYHGTCVEGQCQCDVGENGYRQYIGIHCEFSRPCVRLGADDGAVWDLVALDPRNAWNAYGRGVYRYVTGGNMSISQPEDDWVLIYTGARYFAALLEDGKCKERDYWLQYAEEAHAFWDQIYTEKTHAVSDPTQGSTPIAVDFFLIGRRGERYGPLGELIPLQDPPGSGYFECKEESLTSEANTSLVDLVEDIIELQEKDASINCTQLNATSAGEL